MYRRLWFDLYATVLHAEHALIRAAASPALPGPAETESAEPALILRSRPSPLLASNAIPALRATPAVPATHTDHLDTEAASPHMHTPDNGGGGTYRLPLRTRSPLTGLPLRDLLRRGAHAGHAWFTVDFDDAGLRAATTRADRDLRAGEDVPDSMRWRDILLSAAGLGTYPGQTCPGYRQHGSILAWVLPSVLVRLIADTRCSHTTVSGFFVAEDNGRIWLVDDLGERTELITDPDGLCRVTHPTLAWTAAPIVSTDDEADAVFGWDPTQPELDQCYICGAVDETVRRELPSMAGYGTDTTTTCTICGSWEGTDPIFGWRPHPKPWPPQPAGPAGEPSQRPGREPGHEPGHEPGGAVPSP
ncbi:hypothetical protein [Dactylosporangium sp. NPDC048998]|uniref:hypothetical protein n=1 Tax=Dactylosporangium sp. NPDC048998 TaxID=3363976 RepID=UPI00371DB77A